MSKKSKKADTPIEFVPIIQESPGTDPSKLPFPEWSDQEVNAERWDVPKNQLAPGKSVYYLFEDSQTILMPVRVYKWKRPYEVFPEAKLLLYKETGQYSDLVSASRHLLHLDCIRKFIDMVKIVEHLGYNKPWKMEGVTPSYIPATDNDPWKPWHHVYSMTKAGKGQIHNPQVNKIGKYIIRIFWMGCWRKIVVDDLLPVDRAGNVLLPMTEVDIDEFSIPFAPKEVELWPFFIFKAICKVGALSMGETKSVTNYSIAHCLTGWSYAKLYSIENLNTTDSWKIVVQYTDKYVSPEEETDENKANEKNTKIEKEKDRHYPFFLISKLKDLRDYPEDLIPNVTPCRDPCFYFVLVKEISRSKYENLPVLPRWKKFRWLDWAIKKGIWPESYSAQVKKVKVLFGTPKLPTALALDIRSLSERKSEVHHKVEANLNYLITGTIMHS